MNPPSVNYVSESYIKPKVENAKESNQIYILSPWDLSYLSGNYSNKGILFRKPTSKSFSFEKLVRSLKDSLALTLVQFYPLAGQLTTHIDHHQRKCVVYVDYNKGPGARFIHAAALDITILDILSATYISGVVYSLFDNHDGSVVNFDGHFRPLLSVQVTELLDGVFIGFSINHTVVDGSSFTHFSRIFSEIHSTNIMHPSPITCPPVIVDRSIEHSFFYKAQPDEFVTRYEPPPEMKTRIFFISTESMRWLKNRANKDVSNSKIVISSFLALAALIWRGLVRAMGLQPHEMTSCSLAINARSKLEPPLPQEYFGNVVDSCVATTTVDQLLRHNLGMVSSLLQEALLNYDSRSAIGFVNRWREAPSFTAFSEIEASRTVRIAGSPKFDIYSQKYAGLGAPIAFRSGFGNRFPGYVDVFGAAQGGSSVDVEISLKQESMATLESDPEFMDVVSLANAQFCRAKM